MSERVKIYNLTQTGQQTQEILNKAKGADDFLQEIKDEMQNLPDGSAVSAQVALNTVAIEGQQKKVDGLIFDVTAENDGATFASLGALLSDDDIDTLIPTAIRTGGMTIRFVQSSDNKYVQYFCNSQTFTTDVNTWEKMNLEEEVNKLADDVVDNTIPQSGTTGYYINTTGSPGDTINMTEVQSGGYPTFKHYIQECNPGEHIIVNGTGTSTGLLWCFLTADNKKISSAGGGATGTDLDLTVPNGAAKVIINDRTGLGTQTYRTTGEIPALKQRAGNLEYEVDELSESVVSKYGRKLSQKTAETSSFGYWHNFYGLTIGKKYRINLDKTSWSVSECIGTNAIVIGCGTDGGDIVYPYYQKLLSQAVGGVITVELPIEIIADTNVLSIGTASNVGVTITAILDDLGNINTMSEDYRLSIVDELVEPIDPSKEIIPVAYIVHAETSEFNDAVNDVRKHIKPGEYGLIETYALYGKETDESVSKVSLHGTIVEGSAELSKYYYKYCNGIYKFTTFNSAKYSFTRLVRIQTEQFHPKQHLVFSTQDNQIVEHSASSWDFTQDSDGNYTIMEQCYAYLDALALANPNLVRKYDPMASDEYQEGGITIQNIPFIRNRMAWAGFTDYPIYAKGISNPGEYTIGDYTVNLLKTPAYKTFIYRLADDSINNPGISYAPKRRVLIQAGMHSAEVISQICACLFAGEMLSDNINAYSLLSHYDIWIVPCLNGYGGFHDISLTALGVNGNRNYDTPWWIEEDSIINSGYAPADQFETKLSMLIIDYLKPDVAIDAHTLSNSMVQVAPETSSVHIEGANGQVAEAATMAGAFVKNRAKAKYPSLFVTDPGIYIASGFPNNTTFRSYAYNAGCICTALIETNNAILGQSQTLNGDAAISVSAFQLKNLVFSLCEFNITNYKNRQTDTF